VKPATLLAGALDLLPAEPAVLVRVGGIEIDITGFKELFHRKDPVAIGIGRPELSLLDVLDLGNRETTILVGVDQKKDLGLPVHKFLAIDPPIMAAIGNVKSFLCGGGCRESTGITSGVKRAADFNFYWGEGGVVDSVIDVTHNVPVPFRTDVNSSWGILNPGAATGASILRVHDIAAAADFLRVRAVFAGDIELEPDEGLTPDRYPG